MASHEQKRRLHTDRPDLEDLHSIVLDLEELKKLQSIAKRPHVHSFLSCEISNLEAKILSNSTVSDEKAPEQDSGRFKMAIEAPVVDAIALTEKKMDMTLDKIISISKKSSAKGRLLHRASIKSRIFRNDEPPAKGFKARQFTDSRSTVRQGVLAQRRTNGENNFLFTSNTAKKAASVLIRSWPVRWNQPRAAPSPLLKVVVANGPVQFGNRKRLRTMDALFAGIQKQRKRSYPELTSGPRNFNRQVVLQPCPQHQLYQQQHGMASIY